MPPRTKNPQRTPVHLGDDAGFLRLAQVLSLIPVAPRSWWRGIQLGKYPRPVRLSARTVAWRVRDIRRLLAELDNPAA